MFLTLQNITGNVIYRNDRFFIGHIERSSIDPQATPNEIMLALSSLPCANHTKLSNFFCPRFPEYVFVTREPGNFIVTREDVEDIERTAMDAPHGSIINALVTIIKRAMASESKLTISSWFLSFWKHDDGHFRTRDPELEIFQGRYHVTTDTSAHFSIRNEPAQSANRSEVNGFFLVNAFESIFVPLKVHPSAVNQDDAHRVIEKIQERAELTGRLNSTYLVLPTSLSIRMQISNVTIPYMKTTELQSYFGCSQRSQSKLDTLALCLSSLSSQALPFVESNDYMIIQVSTDTVNQTKISLAPVDYVLTRASHLKVLVAQPGKDARGRSYTRILARIVSETTNDFAQVMHSVWEEGGAKSALRISAICPSQFVGIMKRLGQKLNVTVEV